MFSESRKIHLLEQVLHQKDESILIELEAILNRSMHTKETKKSARDFVGVWDKKDAFLIENAIIEGCEQINADEWK